MCLSQQTRNECNEHNLFTWISGITAIMGIVTTVYSMVNLNYMDNSEEKPDKSKVHVDSLVLYFVVAAFVGIVQTSFSILPICKILCRSTWKWVNFIGGFALLLNTLIYISLNMSTQIHYMYFWLWIFLDGAVLVVLTLFLCCRDYKLNQSMDLARKQSLAQESALP